jgi:hypothetical protein
LIVCWLDYFAISRCLGFWLDFAGIERPQVWMIAREQQLAEKLHAYTLPRKTSNSRVKDLVDIALLIAGGGMEKHRIRDAAAHVFERRGTHSLPAALVAPPADWHLVFQTLSEECGLPVDITVVFGSVKKFLEEALAGPREE